MSGLSTVDIVRHRRLSRQAALASSGSTRSKRIPTLYRYLRCGDVPWVTERHNGPFGLRDDDYDDATLMIDLLITVDVDCCLVRFVAAVLSTESVRVADGCDCPRPRKTGKSTRDTLWTSQQTRCKWRDIRSASGGC